MTDKLVKEKEQNVILASIEVRRQLIDYVV